LPTILAELNRIRAPSGAALFVAYHRVHYPAFRLEEFARQCTARIRCATTGDEVEANVVYYPRAAQDLAVSGGRLVTSLSAARNHPNLDVLLGSLAAEYGPRVTALLLSGMARDGLAGLEAVRTAGGRIVVQSPGSAAFPQLPEAAIAAGLGDTVLDLAGLHAVVEGALAVDAA
jgi:two-component system chemotaxis response regulator CheB